MVRWFRRWRQVRKVRTAIGVARRAGRGLYVREWPAAHIPGMPAEVLDWCRQTLGDCRRPHGIDNFDISVAFSNPGGQPGTVRWARLRPMDLYTESRFQTELRAAFELLGARAPAPHVAVALLSWGDIAATALARS